MQAGSRRFGDARLRGGLYCMKYYPIAYLKQAIRLCSPCVKCLTYSQAGGTSEKYAVCSCPVCFNDIFECPLVSHLIS